MPVFPPPLHYRSPHGAKLTGCASYMYYGALDEKGERLFMI
jgi:hypothetical protein